MTAIPRIGIGMREHPSAPISGVHEPMICLVLQGAKEAVIGTRVLRYDPACCFVSTLDLPSTGRVIEASPATPYVAVSLALDRDSLVDLLQHGPEQAETMGAGFGVLPVTPALLAVWDRLLALLDAPQDIPVLAPLHERELLYRMLAGPNGEILRRFPRADGALGRVHRAITWIQKHFDEKIRIDDLAAIAGMSVPSFHRHFKAATAISPLDYQKTLRLQAARRLLLAKTSASQAAFKVGYESASQFSREYARLFGAPPMKDITRSRTAEAH